MREFARVSALLAVAVDDDDELPPVSFGAQPQRMVAMHELDEQRAAWPEPV